MRGRVIIVVVIGMMGVGCSSITQIGNVGNLRVYSIKDTDFFSANRLLIVVDSERGVVASGGGIVVGPGVLAAGFAGQAVLSAGIAYGGAALGRGLEHMRIEGSVRIPDTSRVHIPRRLRDDIGGVE